MVSGAKKLINHSGIYALGSLSRQLVGFLMLPIYTSHLSPSDYGAVGLLAFTLALMEPLLGARLGEAIPKFYFQEKSDCGRASVIGTAFVITGAMSSVVALLIYVLKEQGSNLLFGSAELSMAVGLFGIQLLTQAIEYYGLAYIRIKEKPGLYVFVSLAKLILQLAMNIWLVVFLDMGVMGVVLSGCISSALFALALMSYVLVDAGFVFDAKMGRKMVAFNLPLWFSGLAALYIFSANRYYLRIFGSLDEIGYYELAVKFAGILTLLVWVSFSQFWEMERFKYYKEGVQNPIYRVVFQFLSTVLVVVALGIAIFSLPVIKLMSAPAFYAAAESVPYLTAAMLFSCLSNYASFSLLATGQTGVINRNSYITVAIVTGLNLLLIPRLGHVGAALALMFSLAIQFFIIHVQAKKHYDMMIQVAPLLLALLFASIGYWLTYYFSFVGSVIADVVIRLAVYCVFSFCIISLLFLNESCRPYAFRLVSPFMARFRRRE